MTRHVSCLFFCAQITSGPSQSAHTYLYTSCVFWFHRKKAISGAVLRCMLLVFLEVKLPQKHLPSASHFHVFFSYQVHLPFCYFELFHTTSLSAMFVYIRVPQREFKIQRRGRQLERQKKQYV